MDNANMPSHALCEICDEESCPSCSVWSAVDYCRIDHQDKHTPKHEDAYRTYRIERSSKLGRHLVAEKNLRKGEGIFDDEPLAIGPALMGTMPWSCLGCLRAVFPDHADTCPGCQWPVCSRSCAGLQDPACHQSECELLRIVKDTTQAFRMDLLLPLRCLLLQSTHPKKWEQLQEIALRASVEHVNSVPDREISAALNDFRTISGRVSHIIPDCSEKTVQSVFDLLALRAQGMFTPYSGALVAVYAVVSLLVHSCVPNVIISRENGLKSREDPSSVSENKWKGQATARANRDIRKGEVLTYPLANLSSSTLDRTLELLTARNFRCGCARCIDPTELGTHSGTLKCTDCPGYILVSYPEQIANCNWICDQGCGKKLTTAEVARLHYGLFLLIARVRMEKKMTTSRLEMLLNTVEKFVHPRHYLSITVKRLLSKTYGGEGLSVLTVEELLRKSALSKEVWTTMADPNILLHGATNVAECLFENFRSDFELLKRRFHSEEMSSDRAVREIVDCRSLLSGVAEVCNLETFYPPRAKLVKDAAEQDKAVVAWASSKRLELPEKH